MLTKTRLATYGGHLELSAFAHMTRRNVKVIQPGLVYVIEWNAGGDPSQDSPTSSPSQPTATLPPDASSSGRDKRRTTRDSKRTNDEPIPELPADASEASDYPIYVA